MSSGFLYRVVLKRAAILSPLLICIATPAFCDDRLDVKGGHFNKDEVTRDFFSRPEAAPVVTETPPTEPAKPADSWSVDDAAVKDSRSQTMENVVRGAQSASPDASSPFAHDNSTQEVPPDLTHAAKAIEQLKAMLKSQKTNPSGDSQVGSVIDKARGSSTSQATAPGNSAVQTPVAPIAKAPVAPQAPKLPTLSVILSAVPEAQFLQTMHKITELRQQNGVQIGAISILGLDDAYNAAAQAEEEEIGAPISDEDHKKLLEIQRRIEGKQLDDPKLFQDSLPPKPPGLKVLDDMKLAPSGVVPMGPLFEKYQATSLPIWVVSDGDKRHVFEGAYNPSTLFDKSGRFIAAERNNPRDESGVTIHQPIPGQKLRRSTGADSDRFVETALSFHINEKPQKPASPATAPTPKRQGGQFNLPFIPNCERPESRKTTVAQEMKNGGFDLVFYSPSDRTQSDAAQRWEGKSVPYNGGQTVEYKDPQARWQMLALSARVRCLPSRFRFFEENGQRYLEYREGDSAWVK